MKKKFTFLIAAIAAILMMAQPTRLLGQTTHTIGWGTASGEAGTYTNFEDVSGTVTNVLSFNSQKNNSGSNPAYSSSSSELRLYYHSGGNGGSITITPATGITITGAVMTTSTTPSVSYYVNGGSAVSVTASNNTYTISNISATTSLKIQNVNTSNTQLRIKTIAITYTVSSNPSISAENVNINAGTTSGSITYQINNGTSGAMVTAQVQSGGTIANLAIDNENITTTSVPFTCDANTANTAKTATVRLTYGNVTKDVTITQARYVPQVSGYNIDFEYETESYVDWTFSNIESQVSGTGNPNLITAHGGSYYASTGGHGSASITTASVIANPGTLTCYITKTTTNTSSSTWKIQVKTAEANNWTDVKSQDATSMEQGTWDEFTADLSDYSNVSVRVSYGGSTAVRNIDDLSLTMASTDPSITAANVDIAYDAESGSIAYTIKNTPNPAGTLTATIAQSPASTIEGLTIGTINGSTVAFTCNANNTTTARTATVTLTYTYGDNQTTTKDVVITQAAHPTPSINADNVNINGDATDGSITYTIDNSITGGVLTASTVATWLTPGEVTNTTVPFTCTVNQGAARSATVVLTYTYNTNQTVTKNVTVTQAKAPYTTIPALFAAATGSNQTVDVTFNNWVVSGVSTNGKNVFVTDNQGNGFVIYNSSDQSSTYAVGKILSGTASSCTLKLNNGYAQLTSVSGLTINTGGTVSVADIAMADLSGVHTGALVSYTNLTGSVTDNKYYLSDGTTTIQIYGSLISSSIPIVASKKYDITGIYQQFGNTKEVLPRSTDDIVLKAQMTAPTFNAFTYVVGNTPTAQTAAITGTDFSGNLTVTVAEGVYVVSNDGSTYGSSATFTKANDGSISEQTLYVKLNFGLQEGDYNGRLSFTANYLDAFDVNLTGSVTANPTYNVVLSQPAGDLATIAADPAYAQSGATITLSYSDVDDCYEFSSWSVMWEDTEMHEITPDANNQFTMPAAEVYVSAVFSQKKFTVDYSVNGSIREALQDVVDCGDEAYMWDEDEMEDEGVTMPTGYEFAGWSTSAGSTAVVSSFSPTADATLYAVWAPSGSSSYYVKVTENLTDWSGEYLIIYEEDGVAFDGSLTTLDGGGNVIQVTITDGKIASTSTIDESNFTIASVTGGYSIKSASGYYIGSTSYNNELKTSTTQVYANTLSIDESGNAIILGYSSGSDRTTLRFNSASGASNYRFRYYKSGQQDIQLYKKQTSTDYTRIEDITSTTATLPSIEPTYLITVKDGGVLTLTGANNGDETNLIIEDGGQLIHNTAVNATVQKNINAASSWGSGAKASSVDGWYTITPAVDNYNKSNFGTVGTYDLYLYNEPASYWWNANGSAHSFNTLASGRGYLFASETNTTLSYAGSMIGTSTEVSMELSYSASNDDLKGVNLVGNPFTRNLTNGDVKLGSADLTTYYVAEGGNDLVTYNISSKEIKPGQGFIVQVEGSMNIVFNPSAKRGETTTKPSFISIEAGNEDFMDRAYVQIGQGNTLRKMTINNQVSHVYVMNDGKDYAAATIAEARGEMPVNFKAAQDGQYTITVNPENVEMGYLHLIDNIAGTDIDLLANPSYTFNAKGDDYESRFRLVFSAKSDNDTNLGDDFAFFSDGQLLVTGEGTLQVVDMMGRVISSEMVNGSTSKTIDAKAGVYVLRLINGENVKTQKIVVR